MIADVLAMKFLEIAMSGQNRDSHSASASYDVISASFTSVLPQGTQSSWKSSIYSLISIHNFFFKKPLST